ncbi:TRAP transporter small permease [Sulfitobacter sp. EhC04]|uniref:TRAP transporter small permease n=1 Tax=Sulfitobacter sp. EhC04 TaxID=1849168 RepID=UPI0013731221|nr:TRAP transporter small permease [Sulfitobacter sp. EhC04]
MKVRPRIIGRITLWLGVLSGVFLVAILGMVAAGVVSRYVFNAPIFGGAELVQFASVGMIMCAIPYCGASDSHIRVDIFDSALNRTGRIIGEVIYVVASIAVFSFLIRRAWDKMLDARQYGDATNILNLPIWPMQAFIVLGAVAFSVVLLGQLIHTLNVGRAQDE